MSNGSSCAVFGTGSLALAHSAALDALGQRFARFSDAGNRNDHAIRGYSVYLFALDVLEHHPSKLSTLESMLRYVINAASGQPVVVLSQVPPTWLRRVLKDDVQNVFYQADTIIVDRAIDRVISPEQLVIGRRHNTIPLPIAYQQYLMLFGYPNGTPTTICSYETAALAKMAINVGLIAQIETANRVLAAANLVGADYDQIERVLRRDRRFGLHAYLKPGLPNQHLTRDADTMSRIIADGEPD